MAKKNAKKRYPGVQVEELDADPSPEYWCDIKYDAAGVGHVSHAMAFIPDQGPYSESQVDYWRRVGYPGSESWEVGKPIKVYPPKVATAEMARKQKEGA